ncbi:MAG TPA: hypothetical protein PKI93_04235 [Alphaproteobacteria bacterium]|nr:hypothetical protein [Alphaproteobacteria bacterium]HNS44315.1 hypothetical protein [Alphaproteobacteria bacterium]
MVRGLSNKVIYFILLMILLIGGGGYVVYEYLIPNRESIENELQSTRSEVSAKYNEVQKMKEEFVLLQSQLRTFKELEARGFFDNQDRAAAVDNFTKLVNRVGILLAKVNFESGEIVKNDLADQAKQVVIKSHGKVELQSLDDVDVYTLMKYMQERFPGSVDVTSLKLERTETLNAAVLRQIGSGTPLALVKGSFEFDWRTMTSRDTVAPESGGN